MNPFEVIAELCTFDSAYVRGWRWLLSARYREEARIRIQRRPLMGLAAVLETVLFMVVEVVALVLLFRWLIGL